MGGKKHMSGLASYSGSHNEIVSIKYWVYWDKKEWCLFFHANFLCNEIGCKTLQLLI